MIRITDIIDKVLEFNPNADSSLIERAYVYSAQVHDGQVRLSGEPYLSHPLEVAGILADMNLDSVSIASGLLHDVIEDTHATEEEIENMFGSEVRRIVAGVTKLSTLPVGGAQARHAENIRKMLLAMANDIRVILIKLADRLHNMRTLQYHPTEAKQKKIAKETLDIYSALASRLGIYWIKHELEDTAFMYLNSGAYNEVKVLVAKNLEQREHFIKNVKELLREKL
ncbi:MAG: bifunctional (p)ppGpp synthetase/guanosine-3',5'-bis(diphosphate) 3'-pyrophosphohydrolase, partial [Desulfobacterales bacterium]|nr:bifunctional (p)ppGpp synthetase/guanosine-3',5'-bis(diphosphate) 3'-pyrophosphohydrolase [Desulfobacterales bacterium]